ncbi:GNAT family N-acetyltransferase [Kibdelosporangium phytohabitans]|uniref:GNAT family acetyltransferase n=1 Tax=Kibdelosporangium phytohabitans TaxID=860235 RepID=A0A0N9IEM6_9PSEU|nr:GNAT family N-acetyltransferase [Kibdelosporangium phytohabitans]ALG14906.1 GNAT family acetyltransferase [Kibdelosporangium phytohabitans]MBE1470003.1 GNAT superfamily N-acetyltransferase [Kibdelosporangium phytohabitans]
MITIGPLEAADRAAWQKLFEGYNTFYERTVPQEVYDRAWAGFQSGERMHALTAKLDATMVGIVHFLVHASTTSADVCYLQDLFTSDEARGKGVGRQLIAAVRDWAVEQGCSRVYWHTKHDNHTARLLYDKVAENRGFIHYVIPLDR